MNSRYAKALRARNKRLAAESVPYPGTLNQEDRKFTPMDKYQNDEAAKKSEIPDMSHDWQKQKRDEIGFGVFDGAAKEKAPTYNDEEMAFYGSANSSARTAAIRAHSMNCVKLASLFLGDNVPESVIEAQAVDFAGLSPMAVKASLDRYAETAEDETKEEPKEEEGEKACNCAAAECNTAKDIKKDIQKIQDGENLKQEGIDGLKQEGAAEEKAPEVNDADAELAKIFSSIAAEGGNAEETAEEAGKEDELEIASKEDSEAADIDMNASMDLEASDDVNAAASALASMLEAEDVSAGVIAGKDEEEPKAKTASKRRGVQSIGGACLKIASANASQEIDLSGLWKDAPSEAAF